MHRKLVETVYRISGTIKSLEEAVHLCQLKNLRRRSRHGGEFDVAIPLHRLFQAMEEHLNSGAVQLAHLGTIKHKTRPVRLQRGFHLKQKRTTLFHAELVG